MSDSEPEGTEILYDPHAQKSGQCNALVVAKELVPKPDKPKEAPVKMSKRKRKRLEELLARKERQKARSATEAALAQHYLDPSLFAPSKKLTERQKKRREGPKMEKAEVGEDDGEPMVNPVLAPFVVRPDKENSDLDESMDEDQVVAKPMGNIEEFKAAPAVSACTPDGHLRIRQRPQRSAEIEKQRARLPAVMEEQSVIETILEAPENVSIVCGDTGCGKSTQVPQFLYEAGVCFDGQLIGVTQPRRVAATSVAKRVGEELNDPSLVGHQVRFDQDVSSKEDTLKVKFMTDGVLLRELQDDFLLSKYAAIVIDEAHERSLNCDVLLGLLSKVVKERKTKNPERPLRLVIMSATLRLKDFTENPRLFPSGAPPVVKIDARTFPVTVHFERHTASDYVEASAEKVRMIHAKLPRGGVLVFVTGKHEVRELCRMLERGGGKRRKQKEEEEMGGINSEDESEVEEEEEEEEKENDEKPEKVQKKSKKEEGLKEDEENVDFKLDPSEVVEEFILSMGVKKSVGKSKGGGGFKGGGSDARLKVVPLFAQMSTEQQMEAFQEPNEDERLVVVATNVAETALTLPNIRYVVDSGREKKRVFKPSGVSSFKVGLTSKASADQRAGRAGRVGPGHCYRLFSGAVYGDHMEDFPPPRVLSSPLDATVLLLATIGISNVGAFPWPSPPPLSLVTAATRRLCVLGMVREEFRAGRKVLKSTRLGEQVSGIPLDPRYGLMLVRAVQRRKEGGEGHLVGHACAMVACLTVGELLAVESSQDCHDTLWAQKQSDAESFIAALGAFACEPAYSRNALCEEHKMRFRALQESLSLARQLSRLLERVGISTLSKTADFSGVLPPTGSRWLPPPSLEEVRILHECFVDGSIDRLASKSENPLFYKAVDSPELARIHQTSRCFKVRPALLAYSEVIINHRGAAQLRGVVPIEEGYLSSRGFLLRVRGSEAPIEEGKPSEFPAPSYSTSDDAIMGHFKPKYKNGHLEVELPPAVLPLPPGDPRGNLEFGKEVLRGKVFEKLKKFLPFLKASPEFGGAEKPKKLKPFLMRLSEIGMTKRELYNASNEKINSLIESYLDLLPEKMKEVGRESWEEEMEKRVEKKKGKKKGKSEV